MGVRIYVHKTNNALEGHDVRIGLENQWGFIASIYPEDFLIPLALKLCRDSATARHPAYDVQATTLSPITLVLTNDDVACAKYYDVVRHIFRGKASKVEVGKLTKYPVQVAPSKHARRLQ